VSRFLDPHICRFCDLEETPYYQGDEENIWRLYMYFRYGPTAFLWRKEFVKKLTWTGTHVRNKKLRIFPGRSILHIQHFFLGHFVWGKKVRWMERIFSLYTRILWHDSWKPEWWRWTRRLVLDNGPVIMFPRLVSKLGWDTEYADVSHDFPVRSGQCRDSNLTLDTIVSFRFTINQSFDTLRYWQRR
jgi:hypothetical protein